MTDDVCRFCLGQDKLLIIDRVLQFKIEITLKIKIQDDDDHKLLCKDCREKIENFYGFTSFCQRAEEKWAREKSFKVKIKEENKDRGICNAIRIKEEPVDEGEATTALPHEANRMIFPSNRLVYPPFYAMDFTGKLVQMPAMMPLGSPIPLSSLPSSPSGAFPIPTVGSLPFSVKTSASLKEVSSTTTDADSSSAIKKDEILEKLIKKEEIEKGSDSHQNTLVDSPSAKPATDSTAQIEDDQSELSDDVNGINGIINEVHTENEDGNSNNSSTNDKSDKTDIAVPGNASGTENGINGDDKSVQEDKTPDVKHSEDQTAVPDTGSANSTPSSFPRARRGRKRRGSSISSFSSGKRGRGRGRRSGGTPSTPERQETEATSVKRLTRSCTGAPRQRRFRKIVDSDSDDGDFNPDDPDDPNDPEYSTSIGGKQMPSSSSSDSEHEQESKSDKKSEAKKPLETIGMTPSVATLYENSRIRKEENLVKKCPHCQLTYKHWVSYDDHISKCQELKQVEREKLEKEGPPPEEKDDDEDKLIKCIVCLEKFMGSKKLREHMQTHQPKKGPPFECKICKQSFSDKGGLICHNALRHRSNITEPIMKSERKKLHCVDCDEHFTNSGDYICHQVLYHKKK